MALKVPRSALVLVAIVPSGCEQGGVFTAPAAPPPANSNPAITQTGTQTVRKTIEQLRSDQAAPNNGIAASRPSSMRLAASSPATRGPIPDW